MNREGVGLELSPAWLQATATGLLFLLAAWWLVWVLHRVWREVLWREGHAVLTALTGSLGGSLRPSRAGWEIRGTRGSVRVRGGLRGVRSWIVRPDGGSRVVNGWPSDDDLLFLTGGG